MWSNIPIYTFLLPVVVDAFRILLSISFRGEIYLTIATKIVNMTNVVVYMVLRICSKGSEFHFQLSWKICSRLLPPDAYGIVNFPDCFECMWKMGDNTLKLELKTTSPGSNFFYKRHGTSAP